MDFFTSWNLALPSWSGKPSYWRLDVCATVLLSHARDRTHHNWRSLVILYAGQGIHEFGIQGNLILGNQDAGALLARSCCSHAIGKALEAL